MENAYTIFLQIVRMFMMMSIGYYLYRKKITDDKIISGLSDILLYVATPATLIDSFQQEYTSEKALNLIFAFIAAAVVYVIAIAIAELLYKKEENIEKFGVVFSNAGFIGIPLVSGVFGTAGVFYVAPVISMFNVFSFTYGAYIMSNDIKEINIKKILKTPAIIAVLTGTLLFMFKITLPGPIAGTASSFGGLNTPLAMIVLGAHIARGNLKDIFTNKKAYKLCFERGVLIPLIIAVMFKFVPAQWMEVKTILFITLSAPIGALSPVFASKYHQDASYAAQTVCLSTLLSVVLLPVMMLVADMIW
ncbi:MAG: AEC family transporter [Erysipelotrichaceae bacterium]|nr:AEC family transporter [Erysipelotrichaceae bacterium]